MIRQSLQWKMTFFIILPVLAIYALVATVQARWGLKSALQNTQRELRESTGRHATECDVIFARAAEVAEGLARYVSLTKPGREGKDAIVDYIRSMLEGHPGIVGSTVAFAPGFTPDMPRGFAPYLYKDAGGALQYKDLAAEYNYLEENWDWYVRPAKTGRPSWSEPYNDEFGGLVLMCTHSVPFSIDGKFAGVATVDISLDAIRDILAGLAEERAAYNLFSAQGTVISSRDKSLELKETLRTLAVRRGSAVLERVADDVQAGRPGVANGISSLTGRRAWFVYTPLKETGWSLLASIPEEMVSWPVYRRLYLMLGVFLAGLLLLVGIVVGVARRITTPLKRLSAFAKELAGGNLDAQIQGVEGEDEIGQLARTFDKMVVDLKDNVERRIREETARKNVESELHVARRIQSSLLPNIFPAFPDRPEFDLYALNEPATFMAGDFYDFFFIDRDVMVLVMADVSGKGVPAAMFMAVSRTAIRNFSLVTLSPVHTIEKLNAALALDNADCMFVTLFYAHYNIRTGALTYVNAGHNPPYILRPDGSVETLKPTGPLVAAFETAKFREATTHLGRGDLLFTFTDGVTEAHIIPEGTTDADAIDKTKTELYGEDRLLASLDRGREDNVVDVCKRVLADTLTFSHGGRPDDITLLALRQQTETAPASAPEDVPGA